MWQRVAKSSPITLLPPGHSGNYISQHSLQLNWYHVMEVRFNTPSHGHILYHVPLSLLFNQLNKDITVDSEEAIECDTTIRQKNCNSRSMEREGVCHTDCDISWKKNLYW